jgi:hypothetical protein
MVNRPNRGTILKAFITLTLTTRPLQVKHFARVDQKIEFAAI